MPERDLHEPGADERSEPPEGSAPERPRPFATELDTKRYFELLTQWAEAI